MTRLAVCGGVYANPWALEAFVADARRRGAERLLCLGDLGGFGAACDAVWPLLLEHGIECIAGNYDIAIGRGDPDCGCGYTDPRDNHFAQVMYNYTLAETSRAFAAWMRGLPGEWRETVAGVDVHAVHGSPLAVNDFVWESLEEDELALRVRASGAEVLLCTHTGIPWQRECEGTLVVNAGTIGRPANDGRREGWYALVDVEDGRASADLVSLAYDWRAHAAALRASGLPEPFAETVETGWWTTCLEIVPPAERARGRYQLYRGWAGTPAAADGERPVMPLFGSALFPPRLWIYTNFHCNLACDYCVVASSPGARRRSLGLERFRALVDDAVAEGFEEVYVTGGEPFVEPAIVDMLEYASARLPTVCLTNAMLFEGGRRARELERLAGCERLVLQSSVDGARAATHDRWRGEGSFARAIAGIAHAHALGLPLRVAMTATPENAGEAEELGELLAGAGVADFAVRPLVRRGFAERRGVGAEVSQAVMVPELTVTEDGLHWHPVGADLDSSRDMLVAPAPASLAEGKRLVTERFLALRLEDGSLPQPYQCAV
jgi:predicted phosphodiesterase/pyruvate-formate lyase-activating enzyme